MSSATTAKYEATWSLSFFLQYNCVIKKIKRVWIPQEDCFKFNSNVIFPADYEVNQIISLWRLQFTTCVNYHLVHVMSSTLWKENEENPKWRESCDFIAI